MSQHPECTTIEDPRRHGAYKGDHVCPACGNRIIGRFGHKNQPEPTAQELLDYIKACEPSYEMAEQIVMDNGGWWAYQEKLYQQKISEIKFT